MKKNILILVGVLSLASCSIHREIKKDTKAHDPEISVSSFGMVIKPIVADLKVESVKQSVTYTADLKLPISELKNNAMELFLITHKCDYVVDPVFSRVTTIENSKLNEIKITITGFAATYTKVYQVDSLPKSVIQYSSISLPVKRVDYTNSITSATEGKSLGMEFAIGFVQTGFVGAQIDYAKNIKGLHYYLSFEKYSNEGKLDFDYAVSTDKKTGTVSYNHNAYSFGVFKEKDFSNRFKIRGAVGVNYSNMPFTKSYIGDPLDKTSFINLSSLGFRFGAAADYRLFGGISLIGRAHANVGIINFIGQDGNYTSEVSAIKNNDYPLINVSAGIRFNF